MFMLRKKIKRFIYILSSLIVVICILSFNVSALTTTTNVNDFISIVNSSLNLYKKSSGGFVDVTASQSFSEVGSDLYYSSTSTESWGPGQLYRFVFSCDIKSNVAFSNLIYYGSFQLVGNSALYDFLLDHGASVYFTNSDGSYTYCNLSKGTSALNVSFDSGSYKEPVSLSIYCDFTNLVNTVAYSTNFDISIMYLNFNQVSESEYITSNQNNNTNQIINNQDKNAADIQANQDKNTDKITNGWQSDSDIDTSTTDDYAAKDKELQDATAQGRSETVSIFNSFGSLFQSDGHLYKGLLAVSSVFTEFMKIDWLSSLVNFSLAIGVFAFVIGTGSEVFKSAHEQHENYKIDKIDSYDERWYM